MPSIHIRVAGWSSPPSTSRSRASRRLFNDLPRLIAWPWYLLLAPLVTSRTARSRRRSGPGLAKALRSHRAVAYASATRPLAYPSTRGDGSPACTALDQLALAWRYHSRVSPSMSPRTLAVGAQRATRSNVRSAGSPFFPTPMVTSSHVSLLSLHAVRQLELRSKVMHFRQALDCKNIDVCVPTGAAGYVGPQNGAGACC